MQYPWCLGVGTGDRGPVIGFEGVMEKTEYLVLSKKPYSETSLLVFGLSPDCGRLDFIAKGARRYGGKKFPVLDVFRCFSVQYASSKNSLKTWREADLETDFAVLAQDTETYRSACWLAGFALANCLPEQPVPRFYQALKNAFGYLTQLVLNAKQAGQSEDAGGRRAAAVVACLIVFLDESGLLPEETVRVDLPAPRRIIETAEKDFSKLPRLEMEQWRDLYRQQVRWLREGHCVVPPTGYKQ